MRDKKPICTENRVRHDNKTYSVECFDCNGIPDVNPIIQAQAVCFVDNNNIALYQHIGGWNGLPGGKIEKDENWKDTLKRELPEEAGVKLENCGIIGYEKITQLENPKNIFYFLRCWAKVKELDYLQNDPDKKSLRRIVVDIKEAPEKLGYGEKGKIWIKLANEKIRNS